MEQFNSDKFYSYFPSLNDEKNKEREQINRLRRLEYQDYIKKASNENITSKHNENHNSSPVQSTQRSDNTEMEIIVNNTNYETPKNTTDTNRPGSTRHKLLQDLRHTELSKMMYDDAIQNRNQENIENENRKKKEYQKELMGQIEEKRNQIKILKLSEKTAEEAMTKKLEEQLKTEKIRFELEQNKIIHHRLLEKLKNDLENSVQSISMTSTPTPTERSNDSSKETSSNQNEVYKFFKNSGTSYRKINHQLSLPDDGDDNDQIPRLQNPPPPKESCFHIDQRLACPYCNVKYFFCKNCNNEFFKNENTKNCRLFCKNCESQYFMCLVCDKEKEFCNFCQRKRNICFQCVLNYCVNCGKSINGGRKTLEDISKRNVINIDEMKNNNNHQSFKVLDQNNDDTDENDEDIENINDDKYCENYKNHFSTNIDRRSLFHPDYKLEDSSKYELKLHDNINDIKIIDDIDNFDTLRHKTNEKLSKYIKNYGDLTRKKTTVKDKIEKPYLRLLESNSLNNNYQPQQNSKPIKYYRTADDDISNRSEASFCNSSNLNFNNNNNNNNNIKLTTEPTSTLQTNPFVITQLGAMRRQLKLNRLKNDSGMK